MNRSVLFYPDETIRINTAVQKKVASYLFMFCNYNPNQVKVFNKDAIFLMEVLNLYKLLVDSSMAKYIISYSKVAGIEIEKDKFNNYIQLSGDLRTVLGHNVSELNGTDNEIIRYKNWLKKLIGKNEIEDETDYEKPCLEVEKIAVNSINIIEDFIRKLSKSSNKSIVISAWEEHIIDFYCKKSNTYILKGQLQDAYLADHPDVTADDSRIWFLVAKWVRDKYYYAEQRKINNYKEILKKHRSKFTTKEIEKIRKAIDKCQVAIQEKEESIMADCGCDRKELDSNVFIFMDHYCQKQREKLEEALKQVKQKGKGTMLPYDLMQIFITTDFHLEKKYT